MRKTLLEKCEEIVENTYFPFGKNNLKTAKIFSDLIHFHNIEFNKAAINLPQQLLLEESIYNAGSNPGLLKMRGSIQSPKKNTVTGAKTSLTAMMGLGHGNKKSHGMH